VTVKGDLHDIGKNLVGMMLEGAGFEVSRRGNRCFRRRSSFKVAKREERAQVIGMSALLTTTMMQMKGTVEALKAAGLKGKVKAVVGGAPVTEEFARQIGADGYAPDAASAVNMVKKLLGGFLRNEFPGDSPTGFDSEDRLETSGKKDFPAEERVCRSEERNLERKAWLVGFGLDAGASRPGSGSGLSPKQIT